MTKFLGTEGTVWTKDLGYSKIDEEELESIYYLVTFHESTMPWDFEQSNGDLPPSRWMSVYRTGEQWRIW
jgi:hypothetical protein